MSHRSPVFTHYEGTKPVTLDLCGAERLGLTGLGESSLL